MKYELIGKETDGLRRIRRLSDDKLGGLVASYRNLSQTGDCWIFYNARVTDSARVCGNAIVAGNAIVTGNAVVSGAATISGHARVDKYVHICDNAMVHGCAYITDYAYVINRARVGGNAVIKHNVDISGDIIIYGDVSVYGEAQLKGSAVITSNDDLWIRVVDEFTMVWTKSNDWLKIGCKHHSVDQWWELTYTELSKTYPTITRVFRERFASQNPRIKI